MIQELFIHSLVDSEADLGHESATNRENRRYIVSCNSGCAWYEAKHLTS